MYLRTGIRTVFGRKSVEDGAGDYQAELNHSLAPFFKSVTLNIKKVKKVKKVEVVTWKIEWHLSVTMLRVSSVISWSFVRLTLTRKK